MIHGNKTYHMWIDHKYGGLKGGFYLSLDLINKSVRFRFLIVTGMGGWGNSFFRALFVIVLFQLVLICCCIREY